MISILFLWIWCTLVPVWTFHGVQEPLSKVKWTKRLKLKLFVLNREDELTNLLNSYDFRGAYEVLKEDPMLKISDENAIKILNNIIQMEPRPITNSPADLSKKGAESCTLIYRRLEQQKVLRGFNSLGNVYPESSTEISPAKLEAISGLSLSALTPKTRTTYWRIVSISLLLTELIFGIYYGIDPVFTLIPITFFAIAFDQIALKGAIFESFYRILFPDYRKKIVIHEAGHLLIAYLLGLPITAVVTNSWEARKYPEIQGNAGTIFFDSKFSEELNQQKVSRTSLDRLSVALMAGIAAEAVKFGVCEGGAADERSLISLFTSISPAWNVLRIQGQARWAVVQCILLLREHKEAFEATIQAIDQNRELGDIIFEIEKHLPAELPATKRLEERKILQKEKDRELLFRLVQRKTWNVGGIQQIEESLPRQLVESPHDEENISNSEEQKYQDEDPIDIFAKKIEMLQRAVSKGDIDVSGQTTGGLWLNDLRSLRKPVVDDSLRSQLHATSNISITNSNQQKDDMDTYQFLRTNRGYMMKELELEEIKNQQKLVKIEERLKVMNQHR